LSTPKSWHFVGALGTEERSLCARNLLRALGVLERESLAQVNDRQPNKFSNRTTAALDARMAEFRGNGGRPDSISEFSILEELFRIQGFAKEVIAQEQSIVLDITSLPKRFYFPILREFAKNKAVCNLVLTYTAPKSYAADGPLYEDCEIWRHLPGFLGSGADHKLWIVSVGFLVESLRRFLGDNPDLKLKVLVPFPAQLAILRRTWESVFELEKDPPGARFENIRVDTLDMSEAFERIVTLARNVADPPAFAPFGPKPISAAMCLYAIEHDCPVYYPQPTVYHPEYTKGIRESEPKRAVNAYWVKHDGENLYRTGVSSN